MFCEHYSIICYKKGEKGVSPIFTGQWPFPGKCTANKSNDWLPMSVAIDKKVLVSQLKMAISEYANWSYGYVDRLSDEPIIEGGFGEPRTGYWQIEIRHLQRWQEGDADVIQLHVAINDGYTTIGGVIEYYSNGVASFSGKLAEFVDGVPREI